MKNHIIKKCGYLIVYIILGLYIFHGNNITTKAALNNLEKVTENSEAILYLDKESATFRVESKTNKTYVETKIWDGQSGNGKTKNAQKSDLLVSYFSNLVTGAYAEVSNYDMAVKSGQLEYETIDNGIKVIYTLKQEELSLDLLPKYVEENKMYDLVIQHLNKKQRDTFKTMYRLYEGRYIRTKDENVTQLTIKNFSHLLYEVGKYTMEDLAADNATYGVESVYNQFEITIKVEYRLDGSDLIVTVPMDECITKEENPISEIKVLPYFLASRTDEEGYIFVPDGSGAIINFNNERTTAINYTSKVYGNDILIGADTYSPELYQASLPIVGMKWEDKAVLAIVEKGAAMAKIHTEISGKSDEFNKVYFSFSIKELERVRTTSSSEITANKYTEDDYKEDIVIRYKFLDKKDASYVGMAKTYQRYLIEEGTLSKKKESKEAPLFLELLGSIEKKKFFIGIPYESNIALTTYKEATNILKDLKEKGINNLQVEFNGWVNNGIKHSSLMNLKLEKVLGSKKDLETLVNYANSNNMGFFNKVNLTGIYSTKNISERNAFTRILSGKYGQKPDILDALSFAKINNKSMYLLSPKYLNTYYTTLIKNFSKYNIKGLSSEDIGNTLVADYKNKDSINRENALSYIKDNLNLIHNNYSLMLANPNAYAFRNADYITDLPVKSNGYNIFNYDVPFIQLVLDGCVPYSVSPINLEIEKDMDEMMLYNIETRSNPKFLLMAENTEVLRNTEYTYLFSTTYHDLSDKITEYYKEYNDFYKETVGAEMIDHSIISESLRKITYSNGVTVYVNYGSKDEKTDSYTIKALNYLVVGKEE